MYSTAFYYTCSIAVHTRKRDIYFLDVARNPAKPIIIECANNGSPNFHIVIHITWLLIFPLPTNT